MPAEAATPQPPPEGAAPRGKNLTWVLVCIIAIPTILALLIWSGFLMLDSWERKTTTCQFGEVQFTIRDSIISIGGREIEIGAGPRVVFIKRSGRVESVVEQPKP
jgi:hypothetical protein